MLLNKFKIILTSEHKISLLYLVVMVVIGMGLEILSLGLIIPIFKVITDRKIGNEDFEQLNHNLEPTVTLIQAQFQI